MVLFRTWLFIFNTSVKMRALNVFAHDIAHETHGEQEGGGEGVFWRKQD